MRVARYLPTTSPIPGVSETTFLIIILATSIPVVLLLLYGLYRASRILHARVFKDRIQKSEKIEDDEAATSRWHSSMKRASAFIKPIARPLSTYNNIAPLMRTGPQPPKARRVMPPTLTHAQIGDIIVGEYPIKGPLHPVAAEATPTFPMLTPSYRFNVGLSHSIRVSDNPQKEKRVSRIMKALNRPRMKTHSNGSLTWDLPSNKAKATSSYISGKENRAPVPF